MSVMLRALGLGLALLAAGCGGGQQGPAVAETPLSLENWKLMPAEAKYQVSTLERLKLGEPQLQEPREWDKFTRAVLIPGKKKDLPASRAVP